jgi:hypothetical protein
MRTFALPSFARKASNHNRRCAPLWIQSAHGFPKLLDGRVCQQGGTLLDRGLEGRFIRYTPVVPDT